jgi:chromosomal replication initiation ATPase DnaA
MSTTDVINRTAEAFDVRKADILSASKSRHIAWARQAAAWALKKQYPHWSCIAIAQLLNRDHTTILYGIAEAEKRRHTNADYRRLLDLIIPPVNVSSATPAGELERRDPNVRAFLEQCEI